LCGAHEGEELCHVEVLLLPCGRGFLFCGPLQSRDQETLMAQKMRCRRNLVQRRKSRQRRAIDGDPLAKCMDFWEVPKHCHVVCLIQRCNESAAVFQQWVSSNVYSSYSRSAMLDLINKKERS
jgi:hypothetical protein